MYKYILYNRKNKVFESMEYDSKSKAEQMGLEHLDALEAIYDLYYTITINEVD